MLAFTLPDHGAATPGAGLAWREHPSWELVEAASDETGIDVAWLLCEASESQLCVLEHAQLAAFVLGLLAVDAVERLGIAPMATAGYGVGEFASLVAAGALRFEDGARVVVERAVAMREELARTPVAALAVLGLGNHDVDAACARAEGGAWTAGYDVPGRVVIAGTAEGVARAAEVARALGAAGTEALPALSAGLQTPLLDGARDWLRKTLAAVSFSDPDPVPAANVDARLHPESSEWPALLSAQLCAPVRWHQVLTTLHDEGARTFLSVGRGTDLAAWTRLAFPSSSVLTHELVTPSDVEQFVGELIAAPQPRPRTSSASSQLASRLVVAAAAGPFRPSTDVAHAGPRLAGSADDAARTDEMRVEVGDLIGWVGDTEIRSSFAGELGGLLVIEGERVMPSQPVAWLRVDAAA